MQGQGFLKFNDQATIDRCVDELRRSGISIAGISQSRQTLEEAFLGIISEAPTDAILVE